MNDKRLTKSYKSQKRATKLTLLSCAWGCSSKLQVIQSFSTLFQWPSKVLSTSIYKHILFLYFLYFSLFLLKKKNQQTNTKTTRLTQKQTPKHTRNARTKMDSLEWVFFLSNKRLGGRWTFPILRPLMRRVWRRIKPIEVCQKHYSL